MLRDSDKYHGVQCSVLSVLWLSLMAIYDNRTLSELYDDIQFQQKDVTVGTDGNENCTKRIKVVPEQYREL